MVAAKRRRDAAERRVKRRRFTRVDCSVFGFEMRWEALLLFSAGPQVRGFQSSKTSTAKGGKHNGGKKSRATFIGNCLAAPQRGASYVFVTHYALRQFHSHSRSLTRPES